MGNGSGRRLRLNVLVATLCGGALLIGAACVGVALTTANGTSTQVTKFVSEATVCMGDPARPDGADGCEQDPMVVCMSDQYYAEQATDAESKRALMSEAAVYCTDAINNVRR